MLEVMFLLLISVLFVVMFILPILVLFLPPVQQSPFLYVSWLAVDSCHSRVIRNKQNLYPKFLLMS